MTSTPHDYSDRLTRGARPLPHAVEMTSVVVGKDILELLSSGMYLDPLTLFREYIQNSADSIDEAYSRGLLSSEFAGTIEVSLDSELREVRIRDNGTGISSRDAERVLSAFGASDKRNGEQRGFRGVGRFAGLGYAQSLTFCTKAAGDPTRTVVRWDCRKLKAILRDNTYSGHIGQVVADVVTIAVESAPNPEEHYFEVSLQKVLRLKNDVLLNEQEVRSYLSQVAPVALDDRLPEAQQINDHLSKHIQLGRIQISIAGSESPVLRPYSSEFVLSKDKTDLVTDVELIEIRNAEGRVRAVGWILHHGYRGAIHGAPEVRGLRARIGDLQVGSGEVFASIFSEPRFNSWVIGELHILDRQLVPNGRRDDFEQNGSLFSFLSQLAPLGKQLARRCRQSSARRNSSRILNAKLERLSYVLDVVEQGLLRRSSLVALKREAVALVAELERVFASQLELDAENQKLARKLNTLRLRHERMSKKASRGPQVALSRNKREAYQDILELVYECSSNKRAAKALVDEIQARLIGESKTAT